ncbi:glycosyltransferase [Cellulomonas sp.]|uniref:glycosyltransferase n=1 Tax=Cellulomonas sp. TaxID=40001 RepID=UPI00281163B8|nr:glycosyltransferase [Cellulomonas sp.]
MTRRRRALVQLNSLGLGGTQLNAVQLAEALVARGWDSLLVGPRDTLGEGPTILDVAAERGVPVEVHDRPETVVSGARALGRTARRWGADLVHVYGSWAERPAYWGPCLLGRRPLVLTVYEMEVDPRTHRWCPLVVGTGYLRDDLRDRPGGAVLLSPPVDLVRDDRAAVDAAPFLASAGLTGDELRVVVVSRLDEDMKALSVETAIRGVARLDRDDVVLVVVGGGDAEPRLRALADATNDALGRRAVVLTGALADPRPAYACADVVLGMGGSAARGLAFGAPLVVLGEFGWSRTFDVPDADLLFRNSFWSDERVDDGAGLLATQLAPLLDDADRRARLGRFGREFAERGYGLEAVADRLADLYAGAAGRYGARRWAGDLPLEWAALRKRPPFDSAPRHPSTGDGRRAISAPAPVPAGAAAEPVGPRSTG